MLYSERHTSGSPYPACPDPILPAPQFSVLKLCWRDCPCHHALKCFRKPVQLKSAAIALLACFLAWALCSKFAAQLYNYTNTTRSDISRVVESNSNSDVQHSFSGLAISCVILTYTNPTSNILILSFLPLSCLLCSSGTSTCKAAQWPSWGNFPNNNKLKHFYCNISQQN